MRLRQSSAAAGEPDVYDDIRGHAKNIEQTGRKLDKIARNAKRHALEMCPRPCTHLADGAVQTTMKMKRGALNT